MLNACDDCRALTSGDCGKHNVGVRDVEMVVYNRVTLSATEYRNLLDEMTRLRFALLEVERHCPCGARPESLNTHPHVTGCPVGNALYPRHNDGSIGDGER